MIRYEKIKISVRKEDKMKDYLKSLDETILKYFKILSEEFPDFLLDYINTPEMQKQVGISVSCGTI